tara:strand:+ start:162 stop:1697 length:1536 start_codon:yes stop_codon:yes gene_type:complete
MLTPGEFVIKKSAVKNIGMGTLAAMNSGQYANGGLVQYRAGGGEINPLKGAVGGGNIKIPSGDQYKQMFYQSLAQISPKKFKALAASSGALAQWATDAGAGVSEADIIKSIFKLRKMGRLDITQMKAPDMDAATFDRLTTASRIFDRVNADEVKYKDWLNDPPFTPGAATFAAAKQRLTEAKDLKTEHERIAGGAAVGPAGASTPNAKFAGSVVNDVMGINPNWRVRWVQGTSAARATRLQAYITWLQNAMTAVPAGAGWGAGGVQNLNVAGGAPAGPGGVAGGGVAGGTIALSQLQRKDKDKKVKSGADILADTHIKKLRDAGFLKMATGGSVPGFAQGGMSDTVPAMLTPGEFVMSKGAVQKHGVGYMKNLNRGRIPGFNRGGVVGKGNVQYKQGGGGVDGGGGGVLSLDPTRLQGVLDTFNTAFSASLDKIAGPFASVSESLGKIAEAFGSMTMTHEFSGDIAMSVNIGNKDAIVEAVKTGISGENGPIATMITNQVNKSIEELKSNP